MIFQRGPPSSATPISAISCLLFLHYCTAVPWGIPSKDGVLRRQTVATICWDSLDFYFSCGTSELNYLPRLLPRFGWLGLLGHVACGLVSLARCLHSLLWLFRSDF